jgi:hypothetical protein
MKTRKCKYCKSVFSPITTLQKNCFEPDCVAEWINEVKEKNWKRKKAKLKMDLMTIQDYVKLAQQVFNKFIRLRDKLSPCISCGNKLGAKFDCGHFYSAGGHWNVRFDERNCSAQCVNCNQHKHGNLIAYRENLLKKIGIEEFENLSVEATKTRKFTIDELKEIISIYKKKIKELELY